MINNGKSVNEDRNKKSENVRPEDYRLADSKIAILVRSDPANGTKVRIKLSPTQQIGFVVIIDDISLTDPKEQCIVYKIVGEFILPQGGDYKITPRFTLDNTTQEGKENTITPNPSTTIKQFTFANTDPAKPSIIIEISDNVVKKDHKE